MSFVKLILKPKYKRQPTKGKGITGVRAHTNIFFFSSLIRVVVTYISQPRKDTRDERRRPAFKCGKV